MGRLYLLYLTIPKSIRVHEFQASGKILITTLNCAKSATKSELKKQYKSRWHVELDIRNMKTTMGMDILSCKTPEMVVKEIWIHLLAYNLIRLMMVQSARTYRTTSTETKTEIISVLVQTQSYGARNSEEIWSS